MENDSTNDRRQVKTGEESKLVQDFFLSSANIISQFPTTLKKKVE